MLFWKPTTNPKMTQFLKNIKDLPIIARGRSNFVILARLSPWKAFHYRSVHVKKTKFEFTKFFSCFFFLLQIWIFFLKNPKTNFGIKFSHVWTVFLKIAL